jgi:uncharacterized protein (TIGR03067 family)
MRWLVLGVLAAGTLAAEAAPQAEATRKDLEKLQGDWHALSWTQDGQELPEDDAQAFFRTIKGNRYTIYLFRKALSEGTLTIDATKRPRTIDAVPAGAALKGKAVLGIYEIAGGKLKLCMAAPGKARPTDFSAKKDSGQTFTVWEREKK